MNKECYKCQNRDKCVRYNVIYNSEYCKFHKYIFLINKSKYNILLGGRK